MTTPTLRQLKKMTDRERRVWFAMNIDRYELVEKKRADCGNCRFNRGGQCLMTSYKVEDGQRPCLGWEEI